MVLHIFKEYGMRRIAAIALLSLAASATLAGCHVESTKDGTGKDVNISTPFGGMQVKTGSDVMATIGLPSYPGAVVVKDDSGNKDGSANVSMNFGGHHFGVQAASFATTDAPDKVEAFYRKGLARYGDVIACRNHVAVGTPVQTAEGLTCDDDHHHGHVSVDAEASKRELELKAGSEKQQHVVTIHADGAGAKFELVALELPGDSDFDGDKGGTVQ
jgi:predicted small secreted protein